MTTRIILVLIRNLLARLASIETKMQMRTADKGIVPSAIEIVMTSRREHLWESTCSLRSVA